MCCHCQFRRLTAACCLLAASAAPLFAQQTQSRTWTNKDGQTCEGRFLGLRVLLERLDGKEYSFPLEKLSEADQQYVLKEAFGVEPGSVPEARDGAAVGTVTVAMPSLIPDVGPQMRRVMVTGVGATAKEAEENAFHQAVEQAVGVLVEGETVVENDKLIRDTVLAHSKGYIQDFRIIKRWEDQGRHHADMVANVAERKLLGKLKAGKVAVVAVQGRRMELQARLDAHNGQVAAKMFERAMQDCRLDKLCAVKILEGPEKVGHDATHAKLRVKVLVKPDQAKWDMFANGLLPLLREIASKRSICRYDGRFNLMMPTAGDLRARLDGNGISLVLVRRMNKTATVIEAEAFRVPDTLGAALSDARAPGCRLVSSLVDREKNVIKQVQQTIGNDLGPYMPISHEHCPAAMGENRGSGTVLGPFLYRRYRGFNILEFSGAYECEAVFDIPLEDLGRVKSCVASIVEIPAS